MSLAHLIDAEKWSREGALAALTYDDASPLARIIAQPQRDFDKLHIRETSSWAVGIDPTGELAESNRPLAKRAEPFAWPMDLWSASMAYGVLAAFAGCALW